jgi:hypothetical protein
MTDEAAAWRIRTVLWRNGHSHPETTVYDRVDHFEAALMEACLDVAARGEGKSHLTWLWQWRKRRDDETQDRARITRIEAVDVLTGGQWRPLDYTLHEPAVTWLVKP